MVPADFFLFLPIVIARQAVKDKFFVVTRMVSENGELLHGFGLAIRTF